MSKERYPEDWDYRDILWWKGQFQCSRCDEVFDIGRKHDIDGNEICDFCNEKI